MNIGFLNLLFGDTNALLKSETFCINQDYFNCALRFRNIKKYEVVDMRLGDLCVIEKKIKHSLREYAPYKFFEEGNNVYEQFCKMNEKSLKRYQLLIESMDKKGYDNRFLIIVGYNNDIMDGMHRASYLLHKYGEDFVVKVMRLEVKKRTMIQRALWHIYKKNHQNYFKRPDNC